MTHDLLTPSAWATWGNCPGSPCLYKDIPEESSEYADEGTAAHALAYAAGMRAMNRTPDPMTTEEASFVAKYCDDVMEEAAAGWASLCRGYASKATHYAFEDGVPLEPVTGRPGATGTADFWARLNDGMLVVCDLKYGMGTLVNPERNGQLSIYGAAILLRLGKMGIKCEGIKLVIYQPRVSKTPVEWMPTKDEFNRFAIHTVMASAKRCIQIMDDVEMGLDDAEKHLVPGEAQCRFCRAKATCPALRKQVTETVKADFDVIPAPQEPEDTAGTLTVPDDIERLAKVLPWLETIENWCDACRAAARARLERGETIPGFKLVAGRKGARRWVDGAEEIINGMRINKSVLYVEKLITPTAAEKAAKKGDIGPRQWAKIKELITQSEGTPAMAPESDPRPAICVSVTDDFETLPENSEPKPEALPAPTAEQSPVTEQTQESNPADDDWI